MKETLEDAAKKLWKESAPNPIEMAIFGADWQAERMYSEEEVKKLLLSCKDRFGGAGLEDYTPDSNVIKWFEQIKK
jgi:hypothetical protein